jgi:hypothetical protein
MQKLLLCASLFVATLFISCSQDNDDVNPPPPPPPPPTVPVEELLTAHTWKMEEIMQLENNALIYYKRGGNANTNNYDNDKLTFNPNGTGTYSPNPAQNLPLTWQFTNTAKTNLDMNINFGGGNTKLLKLSSFNLTDSSFFCVTYFINDAGGPVLSTVTRTPL